MTELNEIRQFGGASAESSPGRAGARRWSAPPLSTFYMWGFDYDFANYIDSEKPLMFLK